MSKQKLKLNWEYISGSYTVNIFDGVADLLVQEAKQPNGWGKFEIIIGLNYYSRDKQRYFADAEEAREFAEGLLLKVGKGIVKKLGG